MRWSQCHRPSDFTYCWCMPECIVITKADRAVLITIVTWLFRFRPMVVSASILLLEGEYVARIERHLKWYSHCFVTLCSSTTGIVVSQCPSARDAKVVTRYLRPDTLWRLNSSITIPLQSILFTHDIFEFRTNAVMLYKYKYAIRAWISFGQAIIFQLRIYPYMPQIKLN